MAGVGRARTCEAASIMAVGSVILLAAGGEPSGASALAPPPTTTVVTTQDAISVYRCTLTVKSYNALTHTMSVALNAQTRPTDAEGYVQNRAVSATCVATSGTTARVTSATRAPTQVDPVGQTTMTTMRWDGTLSVCLSGYTVRGGVTHPVGPVCA